MSTKGSNREGGWLTLTAAAASLGIERAELRGILRYLKLEPETIPATIGRRGGQRKVVSSDLVAEIRRNLTARK